MMSRQFAKVLFLVGLFGLLPLTGWTQVNSVNVQLANLRSDINRLDQVVRSLRLEVESLQRENRQMQEWVKGQLQTTSPDAVSSEQLNAVLRQFEQKIQSVNQVSRQTLVNEVSKEIETLAEQTQKAINALAKAVEGQPQLEQVIVFNDNYPRSGTSYTVKGGDSLARIARELGSKVDWIRNANRLSSDIIYPGQELFIPLKND
ncbi:LysM peptidoglycan-binding domain-containing protein [Puniceicoccales bacterium CK1056]|uniref:LysM peptidoglycan-binding domain-containing protein n=1 Tax=Oceanipulchritudo coccoides TaxID=2706888 RepID=A0A6B2M2H5_9BACT|nr:LysM peptidoglycan-binding domain-containing protein [Oceanipulchritudo coccoides]NDV62522.1 LysM peptidoglycan-binding domain-containing protein [Oceanipulchritudo coccoides]